MIHFDAGQLARILAGFGLAEHLLSAFSRAVMAPLRQRLDAFDNRELLVMPAISERYAGVKILTVLPSNAGTTGSSISGLFILFDFKTGSPLATMDAAELTAQRTSALSAAAASRLARPNAEKLTMLGSGHLVPYLVEAHASARPISQVKIWSRNARRAQAAVERSIRRVPGVRVEMTTDLEDAVRWADIISSATRATEPVILGGWLSPGTHVDLVGGYRPDMREIDDAGILRSRIFVDAYEAALAEAGDLIAPLNAGLLKLDDISGDLSILAGSRMHRLDDQEITLFKSVGTAIADLATAIAAWELNENSPAQHRHSAPAAEKRPRALHQDSAE